MATADSTQSLSTLVEMSLNEARETDRLIKRHINMTRYLLLDMRDRKGWKALGYASFKDYGEKALGYQKAHVYRLIEAAEISLQIGYSPKSPIGDSQQPSESQLRPLAKVPEAQRKAIWDEATRKAEEEHAKLTAKRVEEAVAEHKQRQQELEAQLADATRVASTPPAEATPPVIETTPHEEEPMKSIPSETPLDNLPETALRPRSRVHDAVASPTTAVDVRRPRQHPLDETRHQLYRLGEYLTREYQATGHPFNKASASELQQWNDLANLLHKAAESIQSFTAPQRPALTLIQGGAS